jgi:NAD(P)-dependent dehydrogenase (short-subunit alcohol dehydrogenase family)
MAQQPVVLITGASSGIGQATAELLAFNGFTVFGASRNPDTTVRSYTVLPLDVRSDALADAAVHSILDQAGHIDVLINNAGYTQAGALEENSIADVQAQLDTNLFGVMRMTNAVLPAMRAQGGGRIINVSSVVGHVAPAYVGVYATSKFALEGLTEALRYEVQQFNIHVSLVEPGFVRTNIQGQPPSNPIPAYAVAQQAAVQRVRAGVEGGMEPGAVAQAILRIATSARPRLRYRVGRAAKVLITLKRLLPEPLFERVRRRAFGTTRSPAASPHPQVS